MSKSPTPRTMRIQTIVGGKTSEPERLYTLGEVSSGTGIKTADLRDIYKKKGFTTYNIGNAVCISETDYKSLLGSSEAMDTVTQGAEADKPEPTPVKTKRDYKNEAKAKVKRKFKLGDLISLKIKSKGGSKEIIKGFKVMKFAYSMNDTETNILILKQIYGPKGTMYTLNRHDCKKLHIKYEPGLQVFSMLLNWGTFKPRNKEANAEQN
jgi:hypothetical protein